MKATLCERSPVRARRGYTKGSTNRPAVAAQDRNEKKAGTQEAQEAQNLGSFLCFLCLLCSGPNLTMQHVDTCDPSRNWKRFSSARHRCTLSQLPEDYEVHNLRRPDRLRSFARSSVTTTAGERSLTWAFPVKYGDLPPEPAGSKSVPGSKKTYDQAQIEDLSNPPDWFPEEQLRRHKSFSMVMVTR